MTRQRKSDYFKSHSSMSNEKEAVLGKCLRALSWTADWPLSFYPACVCVCMLYACMKVCMSVCMYVCMHVFRFFHSR